MLSFNLNCCFYSVSDEYFKSLWFFQFNSIKHCIESDQKIISASWHSHATTIASNCSLSVSAASNACITKVVNLYFAILLNCSQRFILKFSQQCELGVDLHSFLLMLIANFPIDFCSASNVCNNIITFTRIGAMNPF